jgi:septum formation protein
MTLHRIVLASASPRRQELLRFLDFPFEVIPSAYEEVVPEFHKDPAELATHLALEKALDVARGHPDALVIGADTVVALGSRIYGKPRDAEDARRMLRELSGHTHAVVTGVAVVPPSTAGTGPRVFGTGTEVVFRELDEREIRAYVKTGEPLDKAGAYAIQGYGGLLIERIAGDYPNVVGLPLTALALCLRDLGVSVLGKP